MTRSVTLPRQRLEEIRRSARWRSAMAQVDHYAPAALILLRILRYSAVPSGPRASLDGAGNVWVRLTIQEWSDDTGLSCLQVRNALSRLERNGLVLRFARGSEVCLMEFEDHDLQTSINAVPVLRGVIQGGKAWRR